MKICFSDFTDVLLMPDGKYLVTNRCTQKRYYLSSKFINLVEKYNRTFQKNNLSKVTQYAISEMIKNGIFQEKSENEKKSLFADIRKVDKYGWLKNLQIEITKRCNLRCLYCYHHTFENVDMPSELFYSLIDQAEKIGTDTITITGGEPFLHPEIYEFLRYIHKKKLGIIIYTNAQCLSDEKIQLLKNVNIKYVQISLDSWDNEINDYQRNALGSANKAKQIAKKLTDNGIRVKLSAVASKLNIEKMKEMYKSCQCEGYNFGCDFMIIDSDVSDKVQKLALTPQEYAQKMWNAFKQDYNGAPVEQGNYCGIGKSLLYVCSNGEVKSCPSETESLLDVNLNCTTLLEAYKKVLEKYSHLVCSQTKCEFYNICSGGCRNRAKIIGGAIDGPDPVQCELIKLYSQLKK